MIAAESDTAPQAGSDAALMAVELDQSRPMVVAIFILAAVYFLGRALASTVGSHPDPLEGSLNLVLAAAYGLSVIAALRWPGRKLATLVQALSLGLGAFILTSLANSLFGLNAHRFAAHQMPTSLALLPLLVVQSYTFLNRLLSLLFLAVVAAVGLQFLLIYATSQSGAYQNPAWWWTLGAILVAVPACLLLAALQEVVYRPLRRTVARSELRIQAENDRLRQIENQDPHTAGLSEVGVLRTLQADGLEQGELHLLGVRLCDAETACAELDQLGRDELADHLFISLREGLGEHVRCARLRDDLFICWNPILSMGMLQSAELLIGQRLQGATFNAGRPLSFSLTLVSAPPGLPALAAAESLLAQAKALPASHLEATP